MLSNNITFILHKPQLSENIGACARGMKNFNFNKLTIVDPKPIFPNDKILATSVGAKNVINKSKVFDKFRERIYSIRSNFVHAGEVLEHEIFGSEESGFPYEVEHFRSAARNFIKISIINWLVEHHSNTPSS